MRHALAFLSAVFLFAGCHRNTGESSTPPVAPPSYRDTGVTGSTLSAPSSGGTQADSQLPDGGRAEVESCVDRWLQEHGLDRYGHPEGTLYTGGTPLFNEATGETYDRLEYVFSRQPEARKACVDQGAR